MGRASVEYAEFALQFNGAVSAARGYVVHLRYCESERVVANVPREID